MTVGSGATAYAYDELDRLLTVTGPGSVSVGYRYDRDGNRDALIYPGGDELWSASFWSSSFHSRRR